MDPAKVAQMVTVLNGLTARDAICLLMDDLPDSAEAAQCT
jgi:hypothetical protein